MAHLEVHELGTGPAVLVLHGTPSPATDLLPLARALAERHRVLVPELPGYGGSPALAAYSLDAVNELLAHELRRRKIGRVAVVGFSGGAYRALDLAVRGDLPVTAVVTIGGFATLPADAREGFHGLAGMLRAQPAAIHDPSLRTLMGQRMLSPAYAASHPEQLAEAAAWLELAPPQVLADELAAFAASADLLPRLRVVSAPILAIVGELDVAAPVARSEEIRAAAGNGSLEIIANAGHVLMWEAAERTTELVTRALAVSG